MDTEPPAEIAAFSLRGVSVHFGTTCALSDLSVDIAPGERVALVGPSGGGKSTFLNLLNATVRPSEGTVQVFEDRALNTFTPSELRKLRSRIGLIPQQLNLIPNVRVMQNILTGRLGRQGLFSALRHFLFATREDTRTIHQLLERVGIEEKLYHRTDHLSGGQQQRVAIARALFQEPLALLADEPVSSIDPSRARDLVSLLTGLAEEQNLTLLMSLHDIELAREFFPRIIGLRQGTVLFDCAPNQLDPEQLQDLYRLSEQEILEQ